MTPRERIFAVLKGEQPDQVPWFGDLDYWANSLIKRGLKPEGFIASNDYIRWHKELGVGFYLQGYFPYKQILCNCKENEWHEGQKHFKEITTPIGSVRECWEHIPTSFSEGPIEHFMKSEADIPVMKFIYENTSFEPDYDFAFRRKQQLESKALFCAICPKVLLCTC